MDIPGKMKALVLTDYHKLQIQSLPVPAPAAGEVLCRIHAVAICGSDPGIIAGVNKGIWPPSFPFVMGHEWAGQVVRTGKNVTGLEVGDRVAGEAHSGCGKCPNCLNGRYTLCLNYGKPESGHRHYGFVSMGANCEFNVFPEKNVHKIPDTLSYRHATLVDTAGVALRAIERIGITPAGTVAVFGPGPMGLCAIQIARGLGAANIIAVGRGYRLELAKKLGADFVVDYGKSDPVEQILAITGGAGADEVVETSGADIAPSQCVRAVRKGGRIAIIPFNYTASLPFPDMGQVVLKEVMISGSRENPNVSAQVITMLDNKMIDGEALITHVFPLEEYEEGLRIFAGREDNCIKVVIEP